LLVRRDRHAADAEINAETSLWLIKFRGRERDRNMQVEVPLAMYQFSGAGFALAKLFAHLRRHLQPAGNAAFRANGQRGAMTVLTKSHCAGVISHGRMWFELVKLIRVACVNGADLCNRVDHVLRGQSGFLTYQAIALVMDVVFAMQILLKGEFGKGVAG